MAVPATPAELLADAKAKYHLLVTGQAARVVADQNGERVEYQGASAPLLLAYIQSLDPTFLNDPAVNRLMRPIGFLF